MERAEILIVGGGVAGLATAWQLAREGRGSGVVLLEGEAHLATHSSALNASILRCLGPDEISTRIALRSARSLHRPPDDFSDVPLVDRRGLVLSAGPASVDELTRWIEEQGHALRFESLTDSKLRERVPAFAAASSAAYFFPDEGQIDIAALNAGFARGARAGGVSLRRNCPVEDLWVEGGRVVGARLRDGTAIRADTSVLAAGGWAGALGTRAGSTVSLRPTRRHLMITSPDPRVGRDWPVLWRLGDGGRNGARNGEGEGEFYCRPDAGGLLLCACEVGDVEPDRCERDAGLEDTIAGRVARYLPSLADIGAAHFWCGIRTLTLDGRFAIGPDPDLAGLFWVAGLAGSGMTSSFEVGRIAAAKLLGQPLDPDIARALDPARLGVPAGRGSAAGRSAKPEAANPV